MDWGFEDIDLDEPAQPTTLDRELVPEGEHAFQIKRVEETDKRLKITLAHAEPRYGWVWVELPKDKDWAARIMASLAKALGMTPEEWRATQVGDLVGRHVRCQVYHREGNAGKVFVNARKFVAAMAADVPAATAEKPAAKRSQAAKAHAATTEGNADAIPF